MVLTGRYGRGAPSPFAARPRRDDPRTADPAARGTLPSSAGNVGVAGLMVGEDVRHAIAADAGPAAVYLLPDVALQGDVFLDNVPLDDVVIAAPAPVLVVPATVAGLLDGLADDHQRRNFERVAPSGVFSRSKLPPLSPIRQI